MSNDFFCFSKISKVCNHHSNPMLPHLQSTFASTPQPQGATNLESYTTRHWCVASFPSPNVFEAHPCHSVLLHVVLLYSYALLCFCNCQLMDIGIVPTFWLLWTTPSWSELKVLGWKEARVYSQETRLSPSLVNCMIGFLIHRVQVTNPSPALLPK